MTKMIFTTSNLLINTDVPKVITQGHYTEVQEYSKADLDSKHSLQAEAFRAKADEIAKNWCGPILFASPWMKVEYLRGGNTFTAKYRLDGDWNDDDPSSKIYDRVLIVTATSLLN